MKPKRRSAAPKSGTGNGPAQSGEQVALPAALETVDDQVSVSAAPASRTRAPRAPRVPRAPSPTPISMQAVVGPNPLADRSGEGVAVVHLVAELAPFARTGGLGEAVRSLAEFQHASGIPTAVIMPLYQMARASAPALEPVGEPYYVQVGPHQEYARLYTIAMPKGSRRGGPKIFFIENDFFFGRRGIYGEHGADYPDNARRYAFFAVASLAALPRIAQAPVILHAHDWHTALAPVYLRTWVRDDPFYRRVSTVLSVHNAGFQGHFPPDTMAQIGLPWELYNYLALEWYGHVNFMKGGLVFSDAVTTVSPTHAHELRTLAGGFGLHETFVSLRDRFVGIVNGIDQKVWNPETDKQITTHYSRAALENKRRCKSALQRAFGLAQRSTTPIFGMTARLVYQKGLDLILGYPDYFALDAQFIFLGAGEPRYESALKELAARAPGRIGVELNFTDRLEHRLMAGADMCLMPSQYEPCGLTQMRAQRYGTIPIARKVGGLADTIDDGITGFLFDDYSSEDFMNAAVRALSHYRDEDGWCAMMREAMSRDFGWERSEAKYREVYRKVLASAVTA